MSKKKFWSATAVLMLSILVVGSDWAAAQPGGCAESVAIIAGSNPAPAGDAWLVDALVQRTGDAACVVLFEDSAAQPSDLAGFDAAVISSSVSPSIVGDTFVDADIPILVSEPYVWDDMGMTAATGRETVPVEAMYVADPTHPLSAGLSGTLNVLSSPTPVNFAYRTQLGSAADVVAFVRSSGAGATKATLFAYDEGDPMPAGVAKASRVGFFASYGSSFTDNGNALVDAALDWILADGINLPPASIELENSVVVENDAGASIGALVVADPNPGDDPVLTVDDARFAVSPTNLLTLAPGIALDYETEPSVPIEITATDQGGLSLTATFVLTVVDDPLDNASTDDVADLQAQIDALEATVDALSAQNALLAAGLDRIEAALDPDADGTLNVSAPDDHTIRFEGVDVQITNGLGQTECNTPDVTTVIPAPAPSCNGTGNLVIGYNEAHRDQNDTEVRSGSHNVIIGVDHSYASFANLVVGANNNGLAREAVVIGTKNSVTGSSGVAMGGRENTASGTNTFVTGHTNTASGYQSVVTGGQHNEATGDYSVVLGGHENVASGEFSVVTAGSSNTANGSRSVVNAGWRNTASGDYSAINGGQYNQASGNRSSTSAGEYNLAAGDYSAVTGGAHNTASGKLSAVSGGVSNTASGELSVVNAGTGNTASGESSAVNGGYGNTAEGRQSVVGGGGANSADGSLSAVSGGVLNTAEGYASVVSGGGGETAGRGNVASGDLSVVGGGAANTAAGTGSTVMGGLDNDVAADTSYGSISGGNSVTLRAPTAERGAGWWQVSDFLSSPFGDDNEGDVSADVVRNFG